MLANISTSTSTYANRCDVYARERGGGGRERERGVRKRERDMSSNHSLSFSFEMETWTGVVSTYVHVTTKAGYVEVITMLRSNALPLPIHRVL